MNTRPSARLVAGDAASIAMLRRSSSSANVAAVALRGPAEHWSGQVDELAATHHGRIGSILVIAPDRVPFESIVSGAVVAGIPVGVVPMVEPGVLARIAVRLKRRRTPPKGKRHHAVLAMWKPWYLEWGRRFVTALRSGYGENTTVSGWFADRTTREELVDRLARGPRLVIYAGHGRQRGWSAYRGVRWRHVSGVRSFVASGAVVALTCDNLKFSGAAQPSFGARWVAAGRCDAFVGAVAEIKETAMESVGAAMLRQLATGAYHMLGPFLSAVDADLRRENESEALAAWSQFRLAGIPDVSW